MLKQLATVQDPGRNRQWVRERQSERKREGRLNEITSNRKGLEGSLRPLLCMKASMSHPCVPLTTRLPRTPHSHALLTVSWKQAERKSPILPHHEGREVEGRGELKRGMRRRWRQYEVKIRKKFLCLRSDWPRCVMTGFFKRLWIFWHSGWYEMYVCFVYVCHRRWGVAPFGNASPCSGQRWTGLWGAGCWALLCG